MKKLLFLEKLVNIQLNLKNYNLKDYSITTVTSLVRKKNPTSLIFKTFFLINFISNSIKIRKVKSDFLLIQSELETNFNKFKFIKISDKVDLFNKLKTDKLVKYNKLENIFDFFNFPVKIDLKKELSLFSFLIQSVK